jgi:hypothetical protein
MHPDPEESFYFPCLVENNRDLQGFLLQKLPDSFRAFFGVDTIKN